MPAFNELNRGNAYKSGLLARLNALLDDPGPARVAGRFATHLSVEFPAVFTFLFDPRVDATGERSRRYGPPSSLAKCGADLTRGIGKSTAVVDGR